MRDCALADGGPRAWNEELRYALGRSGERLAATLAAGGEQPSPFDWPLFERVVDASLAVIVHSRAARDRIAKSRPLASVHVVPLALPPAPDLRSQAAALRQELEIPERALVIGAFGVAAAAKRLDVVLRAFGRLAAARPDCMLLVVGPESPSFLHHGGGLGSRLGVARARPRSGVVRPPAGGDGGHRRRREPPLPDRRRDLEHLPAPARAGARRGGVRHRMVRRDPRLLLRQGAGRFARGAHAGRDARGAARSTRTCDARWERTRDAGRATITRWKPPSMPTPRWWKTVADTRGDARPSRRLRAGVPPPPLAPYSRDDVDTELLAEVAAALGDLGVTEADEEILRAVARPRRRARRELMSRRICIDARKLADFGIGTYIRNLLRSLAEIDQHQPLLGPGGPRRAELRRPPRRQLPRLHRELDGVLAARAGDGVVGAATPAAGRLPRHPLRAAGAPALPGRGHHPRHHPPAVPAVPQEPARAPLRAPDDRPQPAPRPPHHHRLGEHARRRPGLLRRRRRHPARRLQRRRRSVPARAPRRRDPGQAAALPAAQPLPALRRQSEAAQERREPAAGVRARSRARPRRHHARLRRRSRRRVGSPAATSADRWGSPSASPSSVTCPTTTYRRSTRERSPSSIPACTRASDCR